MSLCLIFVLQKNHTKLQNNMHQFITQLFQLSFVNKPVVR